MSVLLVDWLGRGGIAQCTWAWAVAARDAGHPVTIVTRPGRELAPAAGIEVLTGGSASQPIAAHLQLVRTVTAAIRRLRPTTVVVQNFVLAPAEIRVSAVAAEVGAQLVQVVHDHRLHTRAAGTSLGLGRSLRRADVVVAHTAFVAERVRAAGAAASVQLVPHPMQVGMFDIDEVVDDPPDSPRVAVHFGVLHRGYKGTDLFKELAAGGVRGWSFHAVGAGATPATGVEVTDGFVDASELVGAVDRAAATVLPYQAASQSGAVVLSQARRTVPLVSAVGGIPEQVDDDVDGLLFDPGAPVADWAAALERLADHDEWRRLADAGRRRVRAAHDRFVRDVGELVR